MGKIQLLFTFTELFNHRKALDAVMTPGNYYKAALNPLSDTETQQWFINSEGTIINGGIVNEALDSRDFSIAEGTEIILWGRYDNDRYENELFTLEYD